MATGDFVHSICTKNGWNKKLIDDFSLNDIEVGCFEDIVLLGSVHLVAVVLLVIPVLQGIFGNLLHAVKYRKPIDYSINTVKLVLSFFVFFVTFIQLNVEVYRSGVDIPTLELWALLNTCLVWAMMALHTYKERTKILPQYRFIQKICVLGLFIGNTIKLGSVVKETSSYNYFLVLFILEYVCVACMMLIALAHWPSEFVPANADPSATSSAFNVLDDEIADANKNLCPENSASLWSMIFFSWISPLMTLGYKQPLKAEDVWGLDTPDQAAQLGEMWEKLWEEERRSRDPSLRRALTQIWGTRFYGAGLFRIVSDGCTFLGPIFLNLSIGFLESSDQPVGYGYLYILMAVLGDWIGNIFLAQYYQMANRVGMQVRSTMIGAIFRKSMVLTHASRKGLSTGRLVNLMAADSETLELVCMFFHSVWSSPIRIALCLFLLYQQIGWSALVGLSTMLLALPIQKQIFKALMMYNRSSLKDTDERAKLVSEVMSSITVVKMYGWENPFLQRIKRVRDSELVWVKKSAYLRSFNMLVIVSLPILVAVVSFSVFASIPGNVLTASIAFTSTSLFGLLRWPLIELPQALAAIASAKVSLGRLEDLLIREENKQLLLKAGERRGSDAPAPSRQNSFLATKPLELERVTSLPRSSSLIADPSFADRKNRPAIYVRHASFTWGPHVEVEEEPLQLGGGFGGGPGGRGGGGPPAGGRGKPNGVPNGAGRGAGRGGGGPPGATPGAKPGFFSRWKSQKEKEPLLLKGSRIQDSQAPGYGVEKKEEETKKPPQLVFLNDINLTVERGQFVTIIGETGSGKSSLLSAFLGDMPLCEEKDQPKAKGITTENPVYERTGSLAFVPQQAFIYNGTVRENICFGLPFQEEWYSEVLNVCMLEADLKQLPAGDLTEIGEKGVNLSGGQKQRVSIARAVYAKAELYLMDDPLSALDAPVAKALFEQAIDKTLRTRGATVVLVTNALQFVARANHVVILKDQAIEAQGSFEELLATSEHFQQMMAAAGEGKKEEPAAKDKKDAKKKGKSVAVGDAGAAGGLILKEDREMGAVSWRVIKYYLNSMQGWGWVSWVVIGFVLSVGARSAASFWLSVWTAEPGQYKSYTTAFYIGIYCLLNFGESLTNFGTQLICAFLSVRAARSLHENMLTRLLNAPMQFFHQNPVGRLLNRFTKDTRDVDGSVIFAATILLQGVFGLFATVIVIGIGVPYMLIIWLPVLYLFWKCFLYFQATAREVKRLDSITRSPCYAYFQQCLGGISSVRAYKAEARLIQEFSYKIDGNLKFDLATFSANRWLTVRLALFGGVIVLGAGFLIVSTRSSFDPALAGLVLSYALTITTNLGQVVRFASFAETSFNSVERMQYYAEVDQEPAKVLEHRRPPKNWPQKGGIVAKNVIMKYRPELPPVLQNISFEIKEGQKVGIVGRTGAGKSSTFVSLFRLVELTGGSIVIDGIDISTIGLWDLRKAMSVIPQDPVLFTGSVKYNLDPFGEHPDESLWKALQRAHLEKFVSGLPGTLEAKVEESGENFSVGQRQLLCLARALLRGSKIIILDEATAAVDPHTDSLIQQTIREEFKGRTVLTIAHRLNTIIDSDMVIVLEGGKILESGTPHALLTLDGIQGRFASMVEATGPDESAHLRRIAQEHLEAGFGKDTPLFIYQEEKKAGSVPPSPALAKLELGKRQISAFELTGEPSAPVKLEELKLAPELLQAVTTLITALREPIPDEESSTLPKNMPLRKILQKILFPQDKLFDPSPSFTNL